MARTTKKVDVQIRGVPADLRRKLAQKAGRKGKSMSKYMIDVLRDDIERPATLEEWFAEVEALLGPPHDLGFSPTAELRAQRDAKAKA